MPRPKLACMALLLPTACAPPVEEGGFEAPDPASRMYAIERAARAGDTSVIPQLVEQLDSDDPAVRLLAISVLKRLTGETHGYNHEDPPYAREAAVRRWTEAVGGKDLNAGALADKPDDSDG